MMYEIKFDTDPIDSWYYCNTNRTTQIVSGITLSEGRFEKGGDGHYSNEDWDKAFYNSLYLTQVIQWAGENGYDGVLFPRNKTISLCYNNYCNVDPNIQGTPAIHVYTSNFTIDLNGCKINIMFDSSAPQPHYEYVRGGIRPYYDIWGCVFGIYQCSNTTIKNGELEGDVYKRDFVDASTTSIEAIILKADIPTNTHGTNSQSIMVSAYHDQPKWVKFTREVSGEVVEELHDESEFILHDVLSGSNKTVITDENIDTALLTIPSGCTKITLMGKCGNNDGVQGITFFDFSTTTPDSATVQLFKSLYFNKCFGGIDEYKQEQTTGIGLGLGAEDIHIENMDIHGFMGDSISGNDNMYVGRKGRAYVYWGNTVGTMKRGEINDDGSVNSAVTTSFYSSLQTIDWAKYYPSSVSNSAVVNHKVIKKLIVCRNNSDSFSEQKKNGVEVFKKIYGGDSTNGTTIPHTDYQYFRIFFYRLPENFNSETDQEPAPTRSGIYSLQDEVIFNEYENAIRWQIYNQTSFTGKEVNGVWYGETVDSNGLPLTYSDCRMGLVSYNGGNNIIKECKIHDCHRGGIANVPRKTLIKDCEFYRCAKDSGIGIPVFNNSDTATRYCINCEEIRQKGLIVEGNYFHDNHGGILHHSIDIIVRNNIFQNMYNVIGVYDMSLSTELYNNKIINCKRIGNLGGSEVVKNRADQEWIGGRLWKRRYVFNNNEVTYQGKSNGALLYRKSSGDKESDTVIKIENNTFDGGAALIVDNSNKNVDIIIDNNIINNVFNGMGLCGFSGCKFTNNKITCSEKKDGLYNYITFNPNISENNTFTNIQFRYNGICNSKFKNDTFNNCQIDFKQGGQYYFEKCEINNIRIYFQNHTNIGNKYVFNGCDFNISDATTVWIGIGTPLMNKNDRYIFKDCNIHVDSECKNTFKCFTNFRHNQLYGTPFDGTNAVQVINCYSPDYDMRNWCALPPSGGQTDRRVYKA